jgi:hypothetical protein
MNKWTESNLPLCWPSLSLIFETLARNLSLRHHSANRNQHRCSLLCSSLQPPPRIDGDAATSPGHLVCAVELKAAP